MRSRHLIVCLPLCLLGCVLDDPAAPKGSEDSALTSCEIVDTTFVSYWDGVAFKDENRINHCILALAGGGSDTVTWHGAGETQCYTFTQYGEGEHGINEHGETYSAGAPIYSIKPGDHSPFCMERHGQLDALAALNR